MRCWTDCLSIAVFATFITTLQNYQSGAQKETACKQDNVGTYTVLDHKEDSQSHSWDEIGCSKVIASFILLY